MKSKAETDAGMGMLDLLRSATCLAAEGIDLPTVGQIKEGNMADILMLDADPTQSVENLRKAAPHHQGR